MGNKLTLDAAATTGAMTTARAYKHAPAFDEGFLQVSDLHKIHYEQYGNRDGKPVLFVHGGPGGHAGFEHTSFFNPQAYRVVLFDQRGAGKSVPAAEIRENTSQHLVSDIEALRQHHAIDRWAMVFGGSWGSALSLLYAQSHPNRVRSLVLRGIFTERESELKFSRGPNSGAARIFPADYEAFASILAPSARNDPFRGYFELLKSKDASTKLAAARSWNKWDMILTRLIPEPDALKDKTDTWLLQHAVLETYYGSNGGFMEDGQLLCSDNLAKIKHIPCAIVNGRYDMFCPPQTAWELHKGLPQSQLYIVPDAGHSAFETGIFQKLVEICDAYANLDL